jgi:O-antigen ligase
MTIAQVREPADIGVRAARYLLVATLLAIQVSSSITVGFEFAVYAVFAWFPSLRERLWYVLQQRASRALLAFLLVVMITTLYGEAPWADRIGQLAGWRRALLFFFAAAAFDDEEGKRELAGIYFAFCLIALAASVITFVSKEKIYKDIGYGIVIHNYAAQSFAFSLAVGIAVVALRDRATFAADPLLRHRPVALLAIVGFIADIAFVLPGRSGYVSLIIVAATLAVTLGAGSRRARVAVAAGVVASMVGVLSTSGLVRERVTVALAEMENAEQSAKLTSGGIRVVMWKNAWQIISEHPVLGVGTGGFKTAYARRVEGTAGWQATLTGDPHSQYLKIWAEQGVFGLLAILAFLAVALVSPGVTPYRELGVAVLLAAAASSLVNSHFSTFFEGRMFFFWLGALLSAPVPSGTLRKPPAQII